MRGLLGTLGVVLTIYGLVDARDVVFVTGAAMVAVAAALATIRRPAA